MADVGQVEDFGEEVLQDRHCVHTAFFFDPADKVVEDALLWQIGAPEECSKDAYSGSGSGEPFVDGGDWPPREGHHGQSSSRNMEIPNNMKLNSNL